MKNSKEILNVALIGCGWIGEDKHVPSILATPDVRLVALCDVEVAKAQRFVELFGLKDVVVYSDYKEMLKDQSIDIVHIAVPNPLHCQLTCDALEAGKNVLCEKPMATTKAECEKMIETAKRMDRKLTIGYQWRYRPEALKVKEICERGRLGDIDYAKANATRYCGVPAWGQYLNGGNGGGVYIDGVPHALDLTLWAMDNYEPVSVKANLYDKMKNHPEGCIWGGWEQDEFKVEDSGFAVVTMKNGATIYIEASWRLNMLGEDMKTTLCGTDGGLDMAGEHQVRLNGIAYGKPYVTALDTSDPMPPFSIKAMAPGLAEVRHFVDAVRNDTEVFIKPEQAMVVTQIIEGVYESAKTGKEVFF